jgi:hypothetical protein
MNENRTLRLLQIALSITCAIALFLLVGGFLVHHERESFESKLSIGLSKEQVRNEVGEPAAILIPGDQLDSWGNAPTRPVNKETWVYYVFPNSQHRFVLSFSNDSLDDIQYNQN